MPTVKMSLLNLKQLAMFMASCALLVLTIGTSTSHAATTSAVVGCTLDSSSDADTIPEMMYFYDYSADENQVSARILYDTSLHKNRLYLTDSLGPLANANNLGCNFNTSGSFNGWYELDVPERLMITTGDGSDEVKLNLSDTDMVSGAIVTTGDGDDTVVGNHGSPLLGAADVDLTIAGGDGSDTITGGNASDYIVADGAAGDLGNDQVNGADGSDTIYGADGSDTLTGGSGDDEINGGQGNDILAGESGNDVLDGSGGSDQLDGGDDMDTVDYSDRLTPNVLSNDGVSNDGYLPDGEFDNIATNVESLKAGSGNDSISFSGGANTVQAGAGDDLVNVRSGDTVADTVDCETGTDVVTVDTGIDVTTNCETVSPSVETSVLPGTDGPVEGQGTDVGAQIAVAPPAAAAAVAAATFSWSGASKFKLRQGKVSVYLKSSVSTQSKVKATLYLGSKRVRLASKVVTLVAGQKKRITVSIRSSKKKILRAIRKHKVAKVVFSGVDAAGATMKNSAGRKSSKTVKIKR